ncbi:MAG TPA: sensor domain-containing diguanylate cyclase [Actinomycetota bacterium]|nr:sensor domain-containing diguanylate cyclase [Actinomycetota bacterium]
MEIAPLAERMTFMQALRVAFAVIVLGATLVVSDVVGAEFRELLIGTAGYLLLSGTMEGLRRMDKGPGVRIVQLGLLIDGLYVGWVVYLTGGVLSPFRFLFYLHLIAVTLLASYRTGIKIAAWHSLLMLVVLYAESSGVLETQDGIASAVPGESPVFDRFAFFNIAALWFVAIGTAVFSSLNERELKRRKGDVEDLVAMAAALEEVSTAADIGGTVLAHVCDSFGFKRGVILTGDDDQMQLLAYRGPGQPESFKAGVDRVVSKAMSERTPQLVKKLDPEADARLASLLPFAKNVAVFPMTAEGQAAGVLAVEQPGTIGRIERRVVNMVSQFAAYGALSLQNARLLLQVQKQAETDALTGLANRRTFEATLLRELSRAARNGEQLTLAMFDIDHFKSLNDTYGHQTGDDVLKKVAAALVEASRDFDTPARYGGEEFAVILPSCSTRESLAVAERLRKSLSEIEGLPTQVSASSGVATFPTHAGDMQTLIKAADEALYESKRAGRDRVTRSRRRARAKKAATDEFVDLEAE